MVGVRARTADLHRVNCVVRKLNLFAFFAFPVLTIAKNVPKWPSFGDELVTSFAIKIGVRKRDRTQHPAS
jgi:hypothetical protein